MKIKLYGSDATKAENFGQLFGEMTLSDEESGCAPNATAYPLVFPQKGETGLNLGRRNIIQGQAEIRDRLIQLFRASVKQIPSHGKSFVRTVPVFLEDQPELHEVGLSDLTTIKEDVDNLVDCRKEGAFSAVIADRQAGIVTLMARALDLGLDHRSPRLAARAFRYLSKPIIIQDIESLQFEKLQLGKIGWDGDSQGGHRLYRKAILQSRLSRLNKRDVGVRDYDQIRESLLRHFPQRQELMLSLINLFESAAVRNKIDRFEGIYLFHVLFSTIDWQIGDMNPQIFKALSDLRRHLARVEKQKDFRMLVQRFVASMTMKNDLGDG